MPQRQQLRLVHVPTDGPIASWVADVLARVLPPSWTVELATSTSPPSSLAGGVTLLRLGWRQQLARAVHAIRASNGQSDALQPYDIPIGPLKRALDAREPGEEAGKDLVLCFDALIADFTPTLRHALTMVLGGPGPGLAPSSLNLDSGSMTAEALLLIDAYAAQTAIAATASSSRADAVAAVAANLTMDDLHTIVSALKPSQPAALDALLTTLASNHSAPRTLSSRRERKRSLIGLLAERWPLPTSRQSSGRRNSPRAAADKASSDIARTVAAHARAVAAVGAPLCELVSNLATLCASLATSAHAEAFGEVFESGCRCPVSSARASSGASRSGRSVSGAVRVSAGVAALSGLYVGTHHKTGTVLLEQLMQDAAKTFEARFYKPKWADCKLAGAISRSPTVASRAPPSAPRLSLLSLESLGVPPSSPPRVGSFCVDEHVKSLPSTGSLQPPFVHVIRDPLEVCASSYLYALRSNESWLRTPNPTLPAGKSFQVYYRTATLREGLATECRRCFKELRQTASLYEATRRAPHALTLRFEELSEKPAAFDASVRRLLRFGGLSPAAGDVRGGARFARLLAQMRKHDLSRRAPAAGSFTSGHVSNASQKGALRTLLLDEGVGVAAELRRLRERLDYGGGAGARAGEPSMQEQLRKWRLASIPGASAAR